MNSELVNSTYLIIPTARVCQLSVKYKEILGTHQNLINEETLVYSLIYVTSRGSVENRQAATYVKVQPFHGVAGVYK